ncbi:transposase IS605 OrfB, partial [Candidatus Thiomargarita nelsonii]
MAKIILLIKLSWNLVAISVFHSKNYIEVISLKRGKRIAIPVGTNYSITGQIRLILREGQVEIHYTIDNVDLRSGGDKEIGIDKGYTEVFVDSEGEFYGKGFGDVLSKESDYLKKKYQRRNKIKAVLADRINMIVISDIKPPSRQGTKEPVKIFR